MSKRVAFYLRVSTSENQTVENQLRYLNLAAERLGWDFVAHFSYPGISGALVETFRLHTHLFGIIAKYDDSPGTAGLPSPYLPEGKSLHLPGTARRPRTNRWVGV